MKSFCICVVLSLGTLLSGCRIGGQSMTGYLTDEELKSIKAYGEYWEKPGMTVESRRVDWVECGGVADGRFAWKTKEKLAGESDETARTRQEFAFQRCMIRAGYRYTGDCSSAYMKARPLCGAP